MRNFTLLFFLNGLLFCAACKKSDQAPIPKWFDNDAVFTYECSEADTTATSIVKLKTRKTASVKRDYLEYRVELRQTLANPMLTYRGLYFRGIGDVNLVKKKDGLYLRANNVCGMGILNSTFDFLYIPANPSKGQVIQLYTCEEQPTGQNRILHSDTVLTVPAGTFHTFCVLHSDSSKSYWNRDVGVILYELYDRDATTPLRKIATLKLKSVE